MKTISFSHLTLQPTTKAQVEHQEMMGLLVEKGYAVGRWQGVWGKLLKKSGINSIDLKRLLDVQIPPKFNKRGWVRNRLENKDWVKWF